MEPLLFIMYFNDLFSCVGSRNCLTSAFADDVQILFRGDPVFLEVLQSTIDFTVNILATWMNRNDLSINTSKTKVMFLTIYLMMLFLFPSRCNA